MKKLVLAITALMSWTIGINSFGQCTPDESFTAGDNRARLITSTQTSGQSFKAGQSGGLNSVSLDISASNSGCTLATQDVNIEIIELLNSPEWIADPANVALEMNPLTSQVFSVSTDLSQSLVEFTFDNPTEVTAGKIYLIQASLVAGQDCGGAEPNLAWYYSFPTSYWQSTDGIQFWGPTTPSLGNTQKFATCIGEYTPPTPATHLNFDGENDLASFGSGISDYFSGKDVVTIEATVRPETKSGTNNFGVIAGNYDSKNDAALQFLLRRDNDDYLFFINAGVSNTIVASSSVTYNEWQHLAGVWDGDTIYLFVDGELKNKKAISGAFPSISNEFVAGNNYIGEAFDGDIDEIRVWDTALSNFDIKRKSKCELNGDEEGLVAYYQFNEGSNDIDNSTVTIVTDLTGNNYNGTLTNFDLNGMSSNWKAGSDIETGSMIPGAPSATELVSYEKNDIALPLEATTNAQEVVWYTSIPSINGDLTAPTPSTVEDGTTEYWVSSFEMEGCESEKVKITVEVSPIAGISTNALNSVSIYPNPTVSQLNIEVNESSTVTVYNMIGIEVISKAIDTGKTTINGLPSGTYKVIVTNSTKSSATIIVQ